MPDREKVIKGLEIVWDAFNHMEHEMYADYVFEALALLKAQEPIDVIPMDWMDAQIHGYASALKSTELKALIVVKGLWEKEQEAQK